jgi:hypothetical protein
MLGTGLLLYEKSALEGTKLEKAVEESKKVSGKKDSVGKNTKGKAKVTVDVAASAPVSIEDVPEDAPKEGLFHYIQTAGCRRMIVNKVFGNEDSGECRSELQWNHCV